MTAGFQLLPGLITVAEVHRLLRALEPLASALSVVARGAGPRKAGSRTLLRVPEVAQLARSPKLLAVVEPILGPGSFAVSAIYFDKTPKTNWRLPFHQDLMIPVARLAALGEPLPRGWGASSSKEGVPHAEPPAAVLERLLAVRLHLDHCGPANGPLRVIPGSHVYGRLDAERIDRLRAAAPEQMCLAEAGDALLMRPLLLHASSAADSPSHRRVIHLVYTSAAPLPDGMQWWRDRRSSGALSV